MLSEYGLPKSGTVKEKTDRIIDAEIKPSSLLTHMTTDELHDYMKKLGISTSGKKEEKIARIIGYFKENRDIEEKTEMPEEPEEILEEKVISDEKRVELLSNLSTDQLHKILKKSNLPVSGPKNRMIERITFSRYNVNTILSILTTSDLKTICKKLELKSGGNKEELIDRIISHYKMLVPKESKISVKELFDIYPDLSAQDIRAYPEEVRNSITTSMVALDFERVTKYIFENIFHLETRRQRFGREEPDGKIKDEEENLYLYECKTVLNPPYSLPSSHRLQIRNYIQKVSKSRDKDRLKGYFIISNSFSDDIEKKIRKIEPDLDIPIGVIDAKDLYSFARKWLSEYPTETFPINKIVKNGRIALKDFDKIFYN